MALTKIGGGVLRQPIDVGIITATSLNASGIVTAGTVQVGAATTVHSTGIDLGSGNITSHNINSTGIITATSFVGPVTGNVTGNTSGTASNLTGSPSINVTNITASGNVSIAGTLTYEDVTNVDSIGIVTARDYIKLTKAEGQLEATGATGLTLNASHASAYARIRVAGSERVRITSAGLVGIGTDNPAEILHLNGATTTSLLRFTSGTYGTASTDGSHIGISFGGLEVWHKENNYLRFATNNTERLRITSAGLIGIGEDVPRSLLHLNKNTGTTSSYNTGTLLRLNGTNGANALAGIGFGYSTTSNTDILSSAFIGVKVSSWTSYVKHDLVFATRGVDTNTEPSERLRITSGGLVGINTTTGFDTSVGLAVRNGASGSDHTIIDIIANTNETSRLVFSDDTDHNQGRLQYNHFGNSLAFYTNGNTEKVRITSAGLMGLGANNPEDYDGEANDLVVRSGNHTGITIASSGSNQRCNLYFSDGTSGSEKYRGAFTYDHNDDSMMMRTAGAERLRITSAGDVGIGVNPECRLHVEENLSHSSTYYLNADAHIMVDNPGSGKSVLKLEGEAALVYGGGSSSLIFADRQNERMRIHSSGKISVGALNNVLYGDFQVNQSAGNDESGIGILSNDQARSMRLYCDNSSNSIINSGDGGGGVLKLNEGAGQVRIGTGGLTFNGDTAAANALDDYEEGTFTATCANSVTLQSSANLCQYVKIGCSVTVMGQIRVDNSNGSAALIINNLPFTVFSSGEGSAFSVGAVRLYTADMASDHKYVICLTDAGTTNLQFQGVRDNAISQGLGATANGYYMFSVTYRTST